MWEKYFVSFLPIQAALEGTVLQSVLLFPGQESSVPSLNPSLNFPELQRFSLEAQDDCCTCLENVKHPSGFPGADLPSQVMFWVSFPPLLCKLYRGHGRFGLFLWEIQVTAVFSDVISLALRARMFQRTEEWGWAVRKK